MGVAAYHPAGASRARQLSGTDHVLMSWFSLGGNIGFAVAPLLVVATVGRLGLSATPLLLTPALTGVIAVADRKSTRLNSSHVAISYAVFCLKKKNMTQRPLSHEDGKRAGRTGVRHGRRGPHIRRCRRHPGGSSVGIEPGEDKGGVVNQPKRC